MLPICSVRKLNIFRSYANSIFQVNRRLMLVRFHKIGLLTEFARYLLERCLELLDLLISVVVVHRCPHSALHA